MAQGRFTEKDIEPKTGENEVVITPVREKVKRYERKHTKQMSYVSKKKQEKKKEERARSRSWTKKDTRILPLKGKSRDFSGVSPR